jgi:uncharacterized Ntn-hydrolase superfamily protein
MRSACLALVVFLALALSPSIATATWTIVAVDPDTREVGIAGASCILGSEVIISLLPGRGSFVAQAMAGEEQRRQGVELFEDGAGATELVNRLATSESDSWMGLPTYRLRQYGVVMLDREDATANFTGSWNFGWAGARSAPNVSVQGNSLHGPEVVDRAFEAFTQQASGCENRLTDRLMRALEAGARAGGDRRCSRELSALSAFIAVALPGDSADAPQLRLVARRPEEPPFRWTEELLRVFVRPQEGAASENPVFLLRSQYDAWRAREVAEPGCP